MTESKNRRKNPDRRKQKIKKFQNDKRQNVRREEDRENKISYYLVLGIAISIMISVGVLSFLVEKGVN